MRIHFQISSIIVALLFVYAINFKSIVTFNYFINQTEIAELFCINKEKPKLQCEGKCHLATQISQVEDKDDATPFSQQTINYNLEVMPIVVESSSNFSTHITEARKAHSFYQEKNLSKGFIKIFIPPPIV